MVEGRKLNYVRMSGFVVRIDSELFDFAKFSCLKNGSNKFNDKKGQ